MFPSPVSGWGNGVGDQTHYGVHDAIADVILDVLNQYNTSMLTWLNHWYIPSGGDWGYSFDPPATEPSAHDNYLAYTDDPDSYWYNWSNHLLYQHSPSPTEGWGDADKHIEKLFQNLVENLTVWIKEGMENSNIHAHKAAYITGILTHYIADLTQYGHTDYTYLDHSVPEGMDSSYHALYESMVWNSDSLEALKKGLRSYSYNVSRVHDIPHVIHVLARHTNGNGVVEFEDIDGSTRLVGERYYEMLTTYVSSFDAGYAYLGMKGYTQELWNMTLENIAYGVDICIDIIYSAYISAVENSTAMAVDVSICLLYTSPSPRD
mgnify:CR=1 FL=1